MQPRHPNYEEEVRRIFYQAPFISDLGMELQSISPGHCETTLVLAERHRQQDGYVHAGVQATMADHTAGAASGSLIGEGEIVLTAEYKINYLRPAQGEELYCCAQVLRPGKQLTAVEAEVYAVASGERKLVSKYLASMSIVTG